VIHADVIGKTVAAYLQRHPEEATQLASLTTALTQHGNLTSRKTFIGHVTCSAIVIDPAGRVLYIRHNALNSWLRPGGHLEPDDTSLTGAALREVTEETGIPADQLRLVEDIPVDIEVHPIPAVQAKGEPDHQHFDLRYAFTTRSMPDVKLQAEEVHDFRWLPADEIESPTIRHRVAALRPA